MRSGTSTIPIFDLLEQCKDSLYVGAHVDARIPEVSAAHLIELSWLDHHRAAQRPAVARNHYINTTRRISCDLSEGVGRNSTCIMVLDDWGLLEVVLSNSAGLPEAAATIQRLARQWNVPHHMITYDKLGIGRNFPAHLASHGITTAIPYAGEGRPRDSNTFVNLRTEAAWKLRNRLDPSHPPVGVRAPDYWSAPQSMTQQPFYFCPGDYLVRLDEELRPLTYSLVGRKTKLMPKDEWATILGHSPDVADALIQSMILSP